MKKVQERLKRKQNAVILKSSTQEINMQAKLFRTYFSYDSIADARNDFFRDGFITADDDFNHMEMHKIEGGKVKEVVFIDQVGVLQVKVKHYILGE